MQGYTVAGTFLSRIVALILGNRGREVTIVGFQEACSLLRVVPVVQELRQSLVESSQGSLK